MDSFCVERKEHAEQEDVRLCKQRCFHPSSSSEGQTQGRPDTKRCCKYDLLCRRKVRENFHTSSQLIVPLKAARSCGVVQQRHSQLQCGNTVNLMLSLLQSILVPALHYGCQLWGMHTPEWSDFCDGHCDGQPNRKRSGDPPAPPAPPGPQTPSM